MSFTKQLKKYKDKLLFILWSYWASLGGKVTAVFSVLHTKKRKEGKGRKEKGRKGRETKEKRREGRWGGRPRARRGRKWGRPGRNCRDTPWLPLVVQRETAPRPPLQRVEGAPRVGQARCGGGGPRGQTMPSAGRRSRELRGGHSSPAALSQLYVWTYPTAETNEAGIMHIH